MPKKLYSTSVAEKCTLLANFGGPRSLDEVAPFLKSLLTDRDVIRTRLPRFLEYFLFSRLAKSRAPKVREDYAFIGGKSPIFEDTENLARILEEKLFSPVLTFHRYLEALHPPFIEKIIRLNPKIIDVFPCFPQFTYATTGSIARWFSKHLPKDLVQRIRWIKSYPAHPLFVLAHQEVLRFFMQKNGLLEEDCFLLFSAHGVPKNFIQEGDLYKEECELSFDAIRKGFPKAASLLCYQSQFGKEEWLRPYTSDVSQEILKWHQGKKHVLFIPVSFTSDHIETLFEIETAYLPPIQKQGLNAYRVPCFNLNPLFIEAILKILESPNRCNNQMLIRKIRL